MQGSVAGAGLSVSKMFYLKKSLNIVCKDLLKLRLLGLEKFWSQKISKLDARTCFSGGSLSVSKVFGLDENLEIGCEDLLQGAALKKRSQSLSVSNKISLKKFKNGMLGPAAVVGSRFQKNWSQSRMRGPGAGGSLSVSKKEWSGKKSRSFKINLRIECQDLLQGAVFLSQKRSGLEKSLGIRWEDLLQGGALGLEKNLSQKKSGNGRRGPVAKGSLLV